MTVVTSPSSKQEKLRIEEADAWYEYLEDTMELSGQQYTEAEGWAWARLTSRLKIVLRQRRKLEQLSG